MNCLIRSQDLFLNYSVALSRCNAVCVCRVVLPARGDACGTHCADLVGVAQAELGRKRASDVTEKVARAMWTSRPILATLVIGVTFGRQLFFVRMQRRNASLWFPEGMSAGS